MKFGLKYKLICILVFGVLMAFIGQVIFRHYFELPFLVAVETHSDRKDVERVGLAINQIKNILINSTLNHSIWNDAYEVVNLDPEDPVFDRFVTANLGSSAYESLQIDGGLFLDNKRNIKFSSRSDRMTKLSGPTRLFDPHSLEIDWPSSSEQPVITPLIGAGISHSNLGPVMFAASDIVTNDPPYPASVGVWIFWRLLDDQVFDAVRENVQIGMDFIPIAEVKVDPALSIVFEQLISVEDNFLPRNETDHLYWILYDLNNHPVFLVKQESAKRAFAENLISNSVLVGFFISSFILVLIVLFFSQTVIKRLLNAEKTMLHIVNTGNYDERLKTSNNDEIDTMFIQFNQLLGQIQIQNEELKKQNQELEQLSQQDALTGIANRRYLDDSLDRTWRQGARSGTSLSVLMMDVDFFKPYNDNYGHQAGDQVLQRVAQTLQSSLHRATDYLARYGGEEFSVILTDTAPDAAISVAERLCESVEELNIRHEYSGAAKVVTISIGISSVVPRANANQEKLIKLADEALYRAKSEGRNRVCLNKSQLS
jgi:diguanylate cyclase (GGDEF)-like protein